MSNIIEELRKASVDNLFRNNTFHNCWQTGMPYINQIVQNITPASIYSLGDQVRSVFITTRNPGRGQGDLSAGGTAWESLVCWYLNICNIGRRTVIIKHHKSLLPTCVCDAMTVNYNNFTSNTESDLIAITFPDIPEYSMEFSTLNILDNNGHSIPVFRNNGLPNLKQVLDALTYRHFQNLEIHIIQCKTNWNDNAQIPMLWDMVYSAGGFQRNIVVGKNGVSITGVHRFSYSFVTVPSNSSTLYNPNSTAVRRVTNISGGNYWGLPSVQGVALSVKEMLARNLNSGHASSHLVTLGQGVPLLQTTYSYFNI
jgi:hypothetical protein